MDVNGRKQSGLACTAWVCLFWSLTNEKMLRRSQSSTKSSVAQQSAGEYMEDVWHLSLE